MTDKDPWEIPDFLRRKSTPAPAPAPTQPVRLTPKPAPIRLLPKGQHPRLTAAQREIKALEKLREAAGHGVMFMTLRQRMPTYSESTLRQRLLPLAIRLGYLEQVGSRYRRPK